MSIAIIGARGQLGSDLCRVFSSAGEEVIGLGHDEVEIRSLDGLCSLLGALKPRVVVNTAAMHHVEKCEADPESAFAVNALGPRNLALACQKYGIILVQISTDYVFAGSKRSPYVETDLPCPLNVYGTTKLAGEQFIPSLTDRYFVVRTSALYGHSPCRGKGGLNFVDLMQKLAREREEVRVVDSEIVSPTSTLELARNVLGLVGSDAFGLYHGTAEGSCSWYEFAREIFAIRGITTKLAIAGAGEFPAKVKRPEYSVLENGALKANSLNSFKDWRAGLREYLANGQPGK